MSVEEFFLNKSKIHLVPPNSQVGTFLNTMTGVGSVGFGVATFPHSHKQTQTLKETEKQNTITGDQCLVNQINAEYSTIGVKLCIKYFF